MTSDDLENFCLDLDLELGQKHENIEHVKSTFRSLKVLEDYKLYNVYSMLNFDSTFVEMLKLLKSMFLKRKIKFAFLLSANKFSIQIPNIT